MHGALIFLYIPVATFGTTIKFLLYFVIIEYFVYVNVILSPRFSLNACKNLPRITKFLFAVYNVRSIIVPYHAILSHSILCQ